MQFKKGAEAFSSEGDKIGTLERVVVEPKTREVAYLVIQSGFLLSEDKLIPIELVGSVTDKRIEVMASKDKLAELPLYEEIQYVPLNPGGENGENVDTSYWYPPAAGWGMPGYYPLFVQPAYIRTTEKNIPENTVALKEGAKVFASDHKHVGNIERMITTGTDNRITHFVISSGLLLKERKLIPTYWLTDISEDEVHLAVESDFLDRLPEFHLQT